MVEEIVCFLRNGRLIGLLAVLHLWIKVQSAAAPEDNILSNDVISTGKSSGCLSLLLCDEFLFPEDECKQ